MGGAGTYGSSRALRNLKNPTGRILFLISSIVLISISFSSFFPFMHTPPSWHTGQSMHMAMSACTGLQPFLFPK